MGKLHLSTRASGAVVVEEQTEKRQATSGGGGECQLGVSRSRRRERGGGGGRPIKINGAPNADHQSISLPLSSAKPCSRPRPQTRHFALKCKVSLIGLEGNSTVSKSRWRRMTIQFLPSFPRSIKYYLLHITLKSYDITRVRDPSNKEQQVHFRKGLPLQLPRPW